jgi:hypothetical protein
MELKSSYVADANPLNSSVRTVDFEQVNCENRDVAYGVASRHNYQLMDFEANHAPVMI